MSTAGYQFNLTAEGVEDRGSRAEVLKFEILSSFIVDCSFVIAGAAPFRNDK
jgi:hypothetical protein